MIAPEKSHAVPRRSVLYMPGARARALEKARGLPVDSLIFDLEDAVSADAKDDARRIVREALEAGGYQPRECVVRVNGLATPWCEADLEAIAGARPSAILFPKIDHAGDVSSALELMDRSGLDPETPLWVMAETPRGILNIAEIAQASDRLDCIVVGTSDLAKEMRVPHTPGRLGLLTPLSMCVMAARAVGVDVLDGVYLDLEDSRGFARACEQGRNLGFDGKTLIHPDQVGESNRVFSPSAAEVERSRRILDAWRKAKARKEGVAVVDGRLVENLHVEESKRILALHQAIERRGY